MSQRLHVCRICGKKFATPKGLCGHQRIHSGSQRIWGFKESRVCSVSASFMTEIEKHEVIEAAMNLVMLSQGVYDFGEFMDLVVSDSGFEKLSTCSDVVAQGLGSYLRSKLKKKTQSRKSRYKCKICGKSFVCSKVLGGHQTLHRAIKGRLARKMEYTEDGNSLSDSSEAKKIVSQSASFGVSQEEKMLLSVEPKLDFSKQLSHLGFNKSSSCSKTSFSESHSPPDAKKNVSEPLPSFKVSQEEKILHSVESKPYSGFDKSSSFRKTRFSALPSPPEAEKIVPEPPSFAISEDEKMLHSVEPNLDFTKLLSHSGFDKSSSGSKTRFGALPSPPEAKKNASQPSSFEISQDEKMLHSIESKLDFSELLSHSGFDKSSSYSKPKFSALHSPLRSNTLHL